MYQSGGLQCVCEKGFSGDACETFSLTDSQDNGGPSVLFSLFLFVSFGALAVYIFMYHLDKVSGATIWA